MAKVKTIAILGPGAIGGFLAGALLKGENEITLVTRPEAEKKLRGKVLCLKTAFLGDTIVYPRVKDYLTEPVDILCIATKAPDLVSAIAQIKDGVGPRTTIIPFLNGFEHLALLRKEFGQQVAVGMIGNIVVERDKEGCISSSSKAPTIELGGKDFSKEVLEGIADLFRVSGIVVSVHEREEEVIWRKLARR